MFVTVVAVVPSPLARATTLIVPELAIEATSVPAEILMPVAVAVAFAADAVDVLVAAFDDVAGLERRDVEPALVFSLLDDGLDVDLVEQERASGFS